MAKKKWNMLHRKKIFEFKRNLNAIYIKLMIKLKLFDVLFPFWKNNQWYGCELMTKWTNISIELNIKK